LEIKDDEKDRDNNIMNDLTLSVGEKI